MLCAYRLWHLHWLHCVGCFPERAFTSCKYISGCADAPTGTRNISSLYKVQCLTTCRPRVYFYISKVLIITIGLKQGLETGEGEPKQTPRKEELLSSYQKRNAYYLAIYYISPFLGSVAAWCDVASMQRNQGNYPDLMPFNHSCLLWWPFARLARQASNNSYLEGVDWREQQLRSAPGTCSRSKF